MGKPNRYSPEVRERAVRMLLEHGREYNSQWAAICSIAGKTGRIPEARTRRSWIRQALRPAAAALGRMKTLGKSLAAIGICALLAGCASSIPEPPQHITYVALGASDAAGVGARPLTRGYVFRIADELDERIGQVFLANLGVPDANTEQLDSALDLFLESRVEPELVTVWTGANDVIEGEDADDFEDALEDIFDRLRDRTDGIIVVANIPDLTRLPRFREEPDEDVTRERIEEFNEAVAEQAKDYDVLLVDLYRQPLDDDLVSRDGLHPNNQGHQRIADQFLDVILPALSRMLD